MTKFEEEFDEKIMPHKDNLDLMKVRKHFKNWHSDEQFQKLLEQNADWSQECKNINKINAQLTKENEDLKSQLQQQALPVVPECVAEYIEQSKGNLSLYGALYGIVKETDTELHKWASEKGNRDIFARAWLDGFTVEKPQLFYIELPKVFGLSDSTFVSKAESGIISEFTKGKDYALAFTEQEIKSIDERYWQFAVPVEDGE